MADEEKKDAPDFAMLRAVEVLASIANRARTTPGVPPPPIDRPVVLFNETQAFSIGTTTKREVERSLGTGFSYPAKGWHTYSVHGPQSERWLISLFYKDDLVVGIEHYVPKSDGAPKLQPRNIGGFRLIPGEVGLGTPFSALDARYVPAVGGPGTVVYDTSYEIRFPGGLAYVMGNLGTIERLVIYAAP